MLREFVQSCRGIVRDAFRGRAELIAENALLLVKLRRHEGVGQYDLSRQEPG